MNVLFVCLGNICRSPTAEGVMRHLCSAEKAIYIDSAGTGDWHVGKSPDARMQSTCMSKGIDISGLVARQFNVHDFDDFDLIVAMDAQNQSDIERLRPATSITPVKTLLEFSEQYNGDVLDPYYSEQDGFLLTFDQVLSGCKGLKEQLLRG